MLEKPLTMYPRLTERLPSYPLTDVLTSRAGKRLYAGRVRRPNEGSKLSWVGITFIFATLLLAGFVKGVIGLGLPTVAIGLLSIIIAPAQRRTVTAQAF